MFKMLTNGRRNSRATATTPRIQGLRTIRPNVTAPHPTKPPFVPDTPQEQGRDSRTPRVDEPGPGR